MFGNNDDKGSIFDTGGSIFDNKGSSGGSIFSNDNQSSGSLYDRYANDSSNDLMSRYSDSGLSGGPDLVSMYSNSGPDLGPDLVSQYASGPELGSASGFQGSLERSEVGLLQGDEDRLFYRTEAMNMGIMNEDKYKASFMVEDGPTSGMAILNVRGQRHGNRSLLDRMRGLESNHLDLDDDSVSLAESYSDKHLDKRVMNGAYNVTLSDIYNDKRMYMANFGLFTDGIIKPASDTYTEFGQSGNDEDPFDGYSLYAEGHAKSDDYNNFFSRATQAVENDIYGQESVFNKKEETQSQSIFSHHETSQDEQPSYFQEGPAYMPMRNSMFGSDKDEADLSKMSPGERAKYEKQLKDQAEKEEREERKRLAKEEKARQKEQVELKKSKAYEEELRNEYKEEGSSDFSPHLTSEKEEKQEATIFDAIYASSPTSSSKKEAVDEATFSMMNTAEKANIVKDGRAPSSLSEAEKRALLSTLDSSDGSISINQQGNDSVFNFETLSNSIDDSNEIKNENKTAIEKTAKMMSVAAFTNLSDEEKLKAYEEGKTPEDLDNMTLEELKQKLAEEQEKRKASGGLSEMFRKKAEEEENDSPFSNEPKKDPENTFKSLPLDEQLKLIKSGKVPEGVPPALVAKAIQQEKAEIEKQKRMDAKAAARAEKEQANIERIAAENAAIIEELRRSNMPKPEKNKDEETKETKDDPDELELVKEMKKMSKADKPLDDKFEDDEIIIARKIKDSNLNELDILKHIKEREESPFEVFGKGGSYAEKFAMEQERLKKDQEGENKNSSKSDSGPSTENEDTDIQSPDGLPFNKALLDAYTNASSPNADTLSYVLEETDEEEDEKEKEKEKAINKDSSFILNPEDLPKPISAEDLMKMFK